MRKLNTKFAYELRWLDVCKLIDFFQIQNWDPLHYAPKILLKRKCVAKIAPTLSFFNIFQKICLKYLHTCQMYMLLSYWKYCPSLAIYFSHPRGDVGESNQSPFLYIFGRRKALLNKCVTHECKQTVIGRARTSYLGAANTSTGLTDSLVLLFLIFARILYSKEFWTTNFCRQRLVLNISSD